MKYQKKKVSTIFLNFQNTGHTNYYLVRNPEVYKIFFKNSTVAAESPGLNTCDIDAIRSKSLEVIKLLNLPKYCIPLVGLCIGYPDDDPGLNPRILSKGMFFENKYSVENAKAEIEEYDSIYQKYLGGRDKNSRDSNWSKIIAGAYTSFSIDEGIELLKQQGYICIDKK